MDKLEEFKLFVKDNPNLVKKVHNGDLNWQKLYELYDLYGSDNKIWDQYKEKSTSMNDFVSLIKNINLDKVEESVKSIQRVLGVLGDLSVSNSTKEYKPRPIYKHFED